jgi:hypothetical protein
MYRPLSTIGNTASRILVVVFWLPRKLLNPIDLNAVGYRATALFEARSVINLIFSKAWFSMHASSNPNRIIRFGVFEVDLQEAELRQSGLRQS